MKIEKIKQEMINFRDFYGGELLEVEKIKDANTKIELAEIIENHRNHMQSMLTDANDNLDRFKRKINLHVL